MGHGKCRGVPPGAFAVQKRGQAFFQAEKDDLLHGFQHVGILLHRLFIDDPLHLYILPHELGQHRRGEDGDVRVGLRRNLALHFNPPEHTGGREDAGAAAVHAKQGDLPPLLRQDGKGQPAPADENQAHTAIPVAVDHLPFPKRHPLHGAV